MSICTLEHATRHCAWPVAAIFFDIIVLGAVPLLRRLPGVQKYERLTYFHFVLSALHFSFPLQTVYWTRLSLYSADVHSVLAAHPHRTDAVYPNRPSYLILIRYYYYCYYSSSLYWWMSSTWRHFVYLAHEYAWSSFIHHSTHVRHHVYVVALWHEFLQTTLPPSIPVNVHDAFIRLYEPVRLDAWLPPGPHFVGILLWHTGLRGNFAVHHELVHPQTSNRVPMTVTTDDTTLIFGYYYYFARYIIYYYYYYHYHYHFFPYT